MRIARELERRLERLFEGAAGRVFSGKVHPSELAARIAREADLALFDHPAGPATANNYTLTMSPEDVEASQHELERKLGSTLSKYAAEKGLRLSGPARVVITESNEVPTGQFTCLAEITDGAIPPWARLVASRTFPIGPNRAMIGRGDDTDVVIPHDDVSRRHALVWREQGRAWISDLGSTNGTALDGVAVAAEPTPLEHGSMLTLASLRFRFLEG